MAETGSHIKLTWMLQIDSPSELVPRRLEDAAVEIRQVEQPSPEFNWFLHEAVGQPFDWGGRQDWQFEQWSAFVERPGLETWVLYVSGAPAGYFEAELLQDESVRIHCFGLLRRYIGRGLGGHLLTFAIERAFSRGANRVWLTTCNHDHPHAVANYKARGFREVLQRQAEPNRPRTPVLFTTGRDLDQAE